MAQWGNVEFSDLVALRDKFEMLQNTVDDFLEFGHRQTPGRYVKAIGKRLKKSWVQGKFMLTLTERDLQRNLDKIIREKVDAFIMEALQ